MNNYLIASFYKFTPLLHLLDLKEKMMQMMRDKHIKGTIILAEEGINGTIAGEEEAIQHFFNYLAKDPKLVDLPYKKTYNSSIPFDKAKIKIRKEIVTMGVEGIQPSQATGVHVNPADWNHLISDPEVLVVDTRNEYEVCLGTFQHATNPNTLNFRDFPDYVAKNLLDKKDKKIAMFCTGGIRCEKSTAYLLSLGFDKVYQLTGGILNYLEKIPEQDSLWQGSCFIFDDRLALDGQLDKLEDGSLPSDWKHQKRKEFIEKQDGNLVDFS